MMFTTALWLLLIVYLARMVFNRGGPEALPPDWARRTDGEVARLRAEVDRLSGQVDRLVEEQSFLLRLLEPEERPALRPGPEPADAPGPSPMGDPDGHTRGH